MLSLSTAYHINKHSSWHSLLKATANLGFSALELNIEMPENWLPEIISSVARGEIAISSLHNYCPRLNPVPKGRSIYSGYLMTSEDESERRMAVEYTNRTIEWAGKLGAKAVVLHAGEVSTEPSGSEFFTYVRQFGTTGKLYKHYVERLRAYRKIKARRAMDALKKCLDACLKAAAKNNVKLCLENRYFLHEIPHIEEVLELLKTFEGAPLAYWHDTGHAQVFVNMGFVRDHRDFLNALHKNMFGMHLHDLHHISDHYAPGTGELDFTIFKPYVSEVAVKVVEAHSPQAGNTEIRNSIEYLKKTG